MILELIIVLIISQVLFGLYLWYQVKDLYRYPNIFGFPIIGNLYYFYKGFCFSSLHSANNYLLSVSEQAGNGICFGFVRGKRSVVLSCPSIIEEISHNIHASEKAPNVYGSVNLLVKGIFTYCPIDNEWKLRRKEFNNSLTKTLVDGPYSETFTKIGRELVKAFEENRENVDLDYHFTLSSLKIILETHCGIEKPMTHKRRVYKGWHWIVHGVSVMFANPLLSFVFAFTYKIFEIVLIKMADLLVHQVKTSVKGHMNIVSKNPSEVSELKFVPLSVVITLRNKSRNLSNNDLKKELYEVLMAGSHTAAVTFTGSFAILATLPEIQEKVWKEQYEIFGSSKRDPTLEDLRKMSYLDRFLKEMLRFFSPPFVAKNTTAEVKCGGVTIPAGTMIVILLGKLRMDPKYWENPRVFNPDRDDLDSKPKYANAAFGVGLRNCPGMYYARQEMKTIISIIIRHYKLLSSQKFEDFRYVSHLMPEIKNLLPIKVEPRIL